MVVAKARVGNRAGVEVTRQFGSGDGRGQPCFVVEAGFRYRRPRCGNLRYAFQTPIAFGDRTAASIDFEFAQDVAVGRFGLGHQDAHVSGLGRRGEFHVIGGDGLDGLPIDRVIGGLKRRFGCAAHPGKYDAVESAGSAEIHVDPLFAVPGAFPGASEIVWTAYVDTLAAVEERDLPDVPGEVPASFKFQAIEMGGGGLLEKHGSLDRAVGSRNVVGAANLFPGLPIIGTLDDAGPGLRLHHRLHARIDIEPVDHGRLCAGELHLDPGMSALQVDGGYPVIVERPFALASREDAAIFSGYRNPTRQCCRFDAIGNQLRGQIKVVAARLIGSSMQRKIAIGIVEPHRRSGIFFGISGINADAAGKFLGSNVRHKNKTDRNNEVHVGGPETRV